MLVAALAGGVGAVVLRGPRRKLGLVAEVAVGIAAGFAAEKRGARSATREGTA